ncbi:MAG: biotin--[acetyl-CoA-carboxylase] ligase [Acidobacteria bacterium]|nr:biotin--[acetyl-CoA-carboxylase] ligase [Acidobacteriota bacterium]
MTRRIHRYGTVDSTMRIAAGYAALGCPPGTVVVANEQTAGTGRFGRRWHSEKGTGLYLSQVLRPDVPGDRLPVVTLALALATGDAIARASGVICDLRWPNDVVAGGRKCAGILVQLQDRALIAGIGINVNHAAFPEELAGSATSLRIVSGREHSRDALLDELLESIDTYMRLFEAEGTEPILRLFAAASSYVQGRRVVVEQPQGMLAGVTDGLDPVGFLWLRTETGRELIVSGGVRPCS